MEPLNHDDNVKVENESAATHHEAPVTEPVEETSNIHLSGGESATAVADEPVTAPDGVATELALDSGDSNGASAVLTPARPSKPRSSKNGQKNASGTRPRKLRNLNYEESFELLLQARSADHVQLYLRDGRVIEGAILFNDIKGTGRIINVVKEISVDFKTLDVRDIRF